MCDNIQKIATSQRDNYTTGYLLDCSYCKEHYKIIVIDISKQEPKENILGFSKGTIKVL